MKKSLLVAAAAVLVLAACGEKPQGMGGVKQDTTPFSGTGGSKFADPGWKAGDKTSWEQHLRNRAQNGQNDYTRAN
jgi:hypothetical protein